MLSAKKSGGRGCFILYSHMVTLGDIVHPCVWVRDYIRLKHLVRRLIMDCNELLLQLMEEERAADTASPPTAPITIETVSSRDISHKRTRLAALAAGGQAKLTFKGHIVNNESVDTMTDTEVEEVYARYEVL